MCGIVGVVGLGDSAQRVIDGLKLLEYRGYDSAGIASIGEGGIQVRRRKGKLQELVEMVGKEPIDGTVAIGHTRWATHGRPSDANAHPHCVGDLAVVHNGIIENYMELSEELRKDGVVFASETDTEIIAHLVAREEGTLDERVRRALKQVRGAYAIAVLSEREPDVIVVAKNASPLVLGVANGVGVIASDIPAVLPFTREVVILHEEEIGIVKAGALTLTDMQGKVVRRKPVHVDWSPVMVEKAGHRHFMHKEMFEQPTAVAGTLRGRLGKDGRILLEPTVMSVLARARRIVFTACGTSYHACLVGRLIFQELLRKPCEVELASELRYGAPTFDESTLVISVSQSGETADTLAAVKMARALGATVLGVVNVVDSSIARESDAVFYTHAGPEIGVASTKAFITQVTALQLLALGLGRRSGLYLEKVFDIVTALRQLPLLVEETLRSEAQVIEVAHSIVGAKSALFLGRGYGFPIALEGALKLKEISYIHAEGYAAGEMKHGPIALVEPGLPVVFVATQSAVYDKVLSNIQEVRARDGHTIAIATEGDVRVAGVADRVLYVPDTIPMLAPQVATVPLQLLAYHVADLMGTDIDQPRNLAKSVTVE